MISPILYIIRRKYKVTKFQNYIQNLFNDYNYIIIVGACIEGWLISNHRVIASDLGLRYTTFRKTKAEAHVMTHVKDTFLRFAVGFSHSVGYIGPDHM